MKRHRGTQVSIRRRFTLVELLVVMVIVVLLMAVAIPTILKVTSSSGVEAGSRMVGSQLRLARQEAITQRKHVAILFPTLNSSGGDTVAFTGFRPCFVVNDSGTYRFDKWVPNVPWNFVPVGTVIIEADQDGPTAANPDPDLSDGAITTIADVAGFANPVRAVVFRPAGRLVSLQRDVTLVEGALTPGAASPIVRNPENWINLEINQFTGRVRFLRPEDPLS
ncbi:MAG: hypothetical protein JXR77_01615 [Lentisphaeria bacterium]|nr:hypothetical protein [Lentisphaeria bacterium]